MNYWHFILWGLLLASIFLIGCIQPASSGNYSLNVTYSQNQSLPASNLQPMPSSIPTTPVPPLAYYADRNKTTEYFLYNSNRSFTVSLDSVKFQENKIHGNEPSYILTLYITTTNLGTKPLEIAWVLGDPPDPYMKWSEGYLTPVDWWNFSGIDPGESYTTTVTCTIFPPSDWYLHEILYNDYLIGGNMMSYTKKPVISKDMERVYLMEGEGIWDINLEKSSASISHYDSMNDSFPSYNP